MLTSLAEIISNEADTGTFERLTTQGFVKFKPALHFLERTLIITFDK